MICPVQPAPAWFVVLTFYTESPVLLGPFDEDAASLVAVFFSDVDRVKNIAVTQAIPLDLSILSEEIS